MIVANNVTLGYTSDPLMHGVNFVIKPKSKVAIVGANGTGKSTILRALQGLHELDTGEFAVPKEWKIIWVEQEAEGIDINILDYVKQGDKELLYWQKQYELGLANNNSNLVSRALEEIDIRDGWSIEGRAAILLKGFGFTQEEMALPVKHFSGGWRMRLNLAQAMLVKSDLLLLDEPTNHLDIDAIYWLENYLKNYQGTLIFISHDQEFMDKVADHVLHIYRKGVESYTGNYSSFQDQRFTRLERQKIMYRNQQEFITRIQRFIDRFRYKENLASRVQSKIKMLDRLTRIDPVVQDALFSFNFKQQFDLPRKVIELSDATLGYPGLDVLHKVNINLEKHSKIGLLGLNGAGKSTLLRALAGLIKPVVGNYSIGPRVKIGYFNQYQIEQLNLEKTALDHLYEVDSSIKEHDARRYLGSFNFTKEKIFMKVATFSGGEKTRLVLALLVYQNPNVLLLDEPTNHLDLETRQAMTTALVEYNGCVVIVSHDRQLLKTACAELYLVNDGKVTEFDQELDDYFNWLVGLGRYN